MLCMHSIVLSFSGLVLCVVFGPNLFFFTPCALFNELLRSTSAPMASLSIKDYSVACDSQTGESSYQSCVVGRCRTPSAASSSCLDGTHGTFTRTWPRKDLG